MSLIASAGASGPRITGAAPTEADKAQLGKAAAKVVVPQFDFRSYASAAPTDIKADSPQDFEEKVVDLFYGESSLAGALMPWNKTHDLIKFREGETSLWAGYNGHGKSQVTTQCAMDMAWANEVVVIGSFEMAPERTLWRMIRQAARSKDPGIAYIRNFLQWAEGRIWLLSKRGTVDSDWVLAAARYCHKEMHCTQFFVDNLAKCVKGEEDFDGQKLFVDQVCTLGMDTGMHMHLIHHLRKGADEMECPGKMAIKGSGSITDQVDNVAIVWRNKRKEEEREQRTPRLDVMEQPDGVINVVKQRNGEWEGKVGLWYDPESMAYGQGKLEPSRTYDVRADIRIAR
jgi:twinkle protein